MKDLIIVNYDSAVSWSVYEIDPNTKPASHLLFSDATDAHDIVKSHYEIFIFVCGLLRSHGNLEADKNAVLEEIRKKYNLIIYIENGEGWEI